MEFFLKTHRYVLNVLCACRELGIGIVPYSPLGRGFFAGYLPAGKEGDEFRSVSFLLALNSACPILDMFSTSGGCVQLF